MNHKLLFILIIYLFQTSLNAQKIETNLSFGLTTYQGDLVKPLISLKELNLNLGTNLYLHKNAKISFRAFSFLSSINGTDQHWRDRKARNFSFESQILSVGGGIEYTLFGKRRDYCNILFSKTFSPYLFVGTGLLFIESKVEGLSDASIEKAKFYWMFPVGGGLRLDLTKRTSLRFEILWITAFNDYLDGISKEANPEANDWIVQVGLSGSYWFN